MAPLDPRQPVIVGVGQLSRRVDRGEEPLEPVDLMVEALRRAEADSGATAARSGVVAGADTVRVVELFSWRYRDPAGLLAERLGATPVETALSTAGGNSPQMLVNRSALDIQAGRADLVLIAGAESWRTRTAYRRLDQRPPWTTQPDDVAAAPRIGSDEPLTAPGEAARGVFLPVQLYPIFENALRAALGRTIADHQAVISGLWSRFSEVAAANPHAWIREAFSPEQVGAVGPSNRMVGFPYPKLMNSNNAVEQGAGLVLCSVERAEALGVPRDRWVFPHAGTDASDTAFVSDRVDLCSSPAIRTAGRAVLDLAGVGVDDLAHVDLYSCFPSAVEVAALELGLDLDRPLTVTGGLSFAGGPWNNYVTHAIATMAGVLRDDAGSVGLCTANGGYLTKHAFGVYSTEPPSGPFRHARPQDEVDAVGRRSAADDWEGPVTIESCTVMHDRDGGAETGIVAALAADGRRTWGTTADPAAMAALMTDGVIGSAAHLAPDGVVHLAG